MTNQVLYRPPVQRLPTILLPLTPVLSILLLVLAADFETIVKQHAWADAWSSSFNASKSVEMVIGKRQARNSRKPPLVPR